MEAVGGVSAILAIVAYAAKTSKELSEGVNTFKNAKKEVSRVRNELATYSSLLGAFYCTVRKVDSLGAKLAETNELGVTLVYQSDDILRDMYSLLESFGFVGDKSVNHPLQETVCRFKWYMHKGEMTALHRDLDSVKLSLNLFLSMVRLQENMSEPAELDYFSEESEEYRQALEQEVHALRYALKEARREAEKAKHHHERLNHHEANVATVEEIVLPMAKEQLKEQKTLRRRRSNERLRRILSPDSPVSPASRTPESPRHPPNTGNVHSRPPDIPRQGNNQPGISVEFQSTSALSSYEAVAEREYHDGGRVPSGAPQAESITTTRGPQAPHSREVETRHQMQTEDLDSIQHEYETEHNGYFRDPFRPREAGFENVYHDYGPEDAPRTQEFAREIQGSEGVDGESDGDCQSKKG